MRSCRTPTLVSAEVQALSQADSMYSMTLHGLACMTSLRVVGQVVQKIALWDPSLNCHCAFVLIYLHGCRACRDGRRVVDSAQKTSSLSVAAQHSTAQHSTAQHSTAQHSSAQLSSLCESVVHLSQNNVDRIAVLAAAKLLLPPRMTNAHSFHSVVLQHLVL